MDDSQLRNHRVDALIDDGFITTPAVEAAMRTVPRHLFLPDADLTEAYEDTNVPTKTGPDGECLSSASAPHVVALMLEQLEIGPGDRVLEVGAGTGYNAALLTHMGAEVTTVDIDADAVAHTRKALDRAGVEGIRLVEGDGNAGVAEQAPYDRIVVTAGAWDIPPAWIDQLVEGGLLVVPLRLRGTTRAVALRRDRDRRLASESVRLCGFIPMRGSDDGETDIDLGENVRLRCDEDQDIPGALPPGVLEEPRYSSWSGVEVAVEPITGIWGRLILSEAGTCRIAAEESAVRFGRANPAIPMLSPAIVEDGSLAYLATRRLGPGRSEAGAYGHGPAADQLCRRLIDTIRAWDTDRQEHLHISVVPREDTETRVGDQSRSARVVPKHHVDLTLT
ncbi:methyltransferase, FxLD system [Streptomonospora salina]|uniref:Protein-L-isoaspartate O-methyltransferase n=1 Tax=Streptomonospora salina TaxID=104205 RepID=A0A841EAQ7_9ACTN|nr:methyltransferase, FxLD system [Streptomonospora salina]MBB6000086.1 protein-L-isoaspartate(D-aspartate) O-methyltransferase [Streptomonospora salina]